MAKTACLRARLGKRSDDFTGLVTEPGPEGTPPGSGSADAWVWVQATSWPLIGSFLKRDSGYQGLSLSPASDSLRFRQQLAR